MKKTIAFLLIALLTLSFSAGLADSAPKSKEDQMVGLVKGFLEENEFPYEYDDYTFTVRFALENCDGICLHDGLTSGRRHAGRGPRMRRLQGNWGMSLNRWRCSTALANSEIYYAQFRVELDCNDKLYVACRACNLVEDVIPGENELFYLFDHAAELYGGLRRRHPWRCIDGGDPYEAFEACQAAVDAQ